MDLLRKAARTFGLQALDSLASTLENRVLDIGNQYAIRATETLLQYAEKHYGPSSQEAICSRRQFVNAYSFVDHEAALTLSRKNTAQARTLYNNRPTDMFLNGLRLVCELEQMVLEDLRESENPLRWKKLYELEREVLSYLKAEKGDTKEKIDICSYMASLKNTSSAFYTVVNYYYDKLFPKEYDMNCRNLNNIISNAEYYYQMAAECQERAAGETHILTLYAKKSLLEFEAQYNLRDFSEIGQQLEDIKNKLADYLPLGDPVVALADISLWEYRKMYQSENQESINYRSVLRDIEVCYGKNSATYLNCLYRLMNVLYPQNSLLAERLQAEMLELAKKKYANEPDLYGLYLYGAFQSSFYATDSQRMADFARQFVDFYRVNHHPSWASIAQGKTIANDVAQYLMMKKEEQELARIAAQDMQQLAGRETVEYAMYMDEYSRTLLYGDADCYREAAKIAREVLPLYKKYEIPVAIPYSTLAKAYLGLGDANLYEQTLREGISQYQSRDLWRCYLLAYLAQKLYMDKKDKQTADSCFLEALSILNEQEGELWGDFFSIYHNLADCYWANKELSKAEAMLIRGKQRHEQYDGTYDGNYLDMVTSLFTLYAYDMYDLDKAEMIIRERIDAIKDNQAFSLHDVTLQLLSDYLRIIQDKDPDNVIRAGMVVQDIIKECNAVIANAGDDKTQVLPLLRKVLLDIPVLFRWIYNIDQLAKNDYSALPDSLQQEMAVTIKKCEQIKSNIKQQVLPVYLEWKDEIERTNSDYLNDLEYYDIASCLYSYYVYVESDYAKAMECISPFINSSNKAVQANALRNMADLYWRQSNWAMVAKMLEQRKSTAYSDLSIATRSELDIALFNAYYMQKQYDKALQPALDYHEHRMQLMRKNIDLMTQEERESFIKNGALGGEAIYSLLKHYPQKLCQTAYNCMLEEKNLLLRASERIKNAILQSGDRELLAQMDSLHQLNRQWKTKNISHFNLSSDDDVVKLYQQIEALERSINRKATQYASEVNTPDWQKLQKALKRDEAAIEYVLSDSASCGALVLLPQGNPQYIPLTNSSELWSELAALQSLDAERKAEVLYQEDRLRLYEKLWKPMETLLKDVKTVFYSPTGFLNDLAYAAFPCGDGSYLGDHYKLHQMLSTGNLVALRQPTGRPKIESAALYGDVYYSPDHEQLANSISQGAAQRGAAHDGRGAIQDENEAFGYLSFTRQEISQVSSILKDHHVTATLKSGFAATEKTLHSMSGQSPQVLHLSTHGFFINNDQGFMENKFLARFPSTRFSSMQRSGLALAGANSTWGGATDKPQEDDGILTANEVAQLDLSQTQLAVLSACQTAVGEYSLEGVYGMQRGFKQAGVKSILATLWNVNDKSTARFVQLFYQHWLSGETLQQSAREALQTLRQEYPSPFYWAPFVLMDAVD